MEVARFKNLATLAAILWLASIPLTALVLYGGQHIGGYRLFMTGWGAVLVGLNFAWLANVFFLIGLSDAYRGRAPTWSALAAALLSLDAARLTVFVDPGVESAVYGYGWGVVLWLLAIFVLLIVAGNQTIRLSLGRWLRTTGFALCILTAAGAASKAVLDRAGANEQESQRLAGVAFKRGLVCRSPGPSVTEPMRNFSGPLELVGRPEYSRPLMQIKTLLEWGVPVVRAGEFDYSIAPTTPAGEIAIRPARGPAAAILYVDAEANRSVKAKLVNAHTARTVFEQRWNREYQRHCCPEYSSHPRSEEQPRAVMREALDLGAREWSREAEPPLPIVAAVVIGRTVEQSLKLTDKPWAAMNATERAAHTAHQLRQPYNLACPEDVGFLRAGDPTLNYGWPPFALREKVFHPNGRFRRALCQGNDAYLFGEVESHRKAGLRIDARDLHDFRRKWAAVLVLPVPAGSLSMELREVAVSDSNLAVTVIDKQNGQILQIQAALPSS